jgi:hypothetical protein
MDERQDQNWCLERFAGTSTGDGGPLKMRPCKTGRIKQMWSYHKQKKVIASLSGEITTTTNETTAAGFCITRSGRDLVSTLCTSRPENVDTIISDEALNLSQDDTSIGSISIKAGNKEFYLAIDSIRIFSRVKLLKKGTENSSYDKWQLRYKGPSEFPSSIPSSNPSDFPIPSLDLNFRSAVCISAPGQSWGLENNDRFETVSGGAVQFDIVQDVYEPGDESHANNFNASRFAAERDTLVSFKVTGSDTYLRHAGYWLRPLANVDDDSITRMDATYYMTSEGGKAFSFRSINYDQFFISIVEGHLKLTTEKTVWTIDSCQ